MAALAFSLNRQKDIRDAGTRTESDDIAFSEVRDVLKKHGLEKKYGIALLHKHFDLDYDEILVEYTDISNRSLTSIPQKVGSIPSENLIETIWCLDSDEAVSICVRLCRPYNDGKDHDRRHTGQESDF